MQIEWPDGGPISRELTVTIGMAIASYPDTEENCMRYSNVGLWRLVIEGPEDEVRPYAADANKRLTESK